jgi:hypothetical protein
MFDANNAKFFGQYCLNNNILQFFVEYNVLAAMIVNIYSFWDILSCLMLKGKRRIARMYRLHSLCSRVSKARNYPAGMLGMLLAPTIIVFLSHCLLNKVVSTLKHTASKRRMITE